MNLSQHFAAEACQLLDQALDKIEHCMGQLNEDQVWFRPHPALNSIGNLLLHLNGNLRQWSVVGLDRVPDDRQRSTEFAADAREPVGDVMARVRATVADAQQLFRRFDEQTWLEPRTIQGFQTKVLGAVMHTTSHFVGHTHQIILLTRWQLGELYVLHWRPDDERGEVPF